MQEVPDKIIELVVKLQFDYSKKAQSYLRESRFCNEDLIDVVRFGSVKKKEKDETIKGQYKYTIYGYACDGTPMYLVGKIVFDRFFVITFHERS